MKSKIWKRWLAVCLLCAMALTLVIPVSAAGTPQVTLKTEKAELHPGDEFTVQANIAENPGIAGVQFNLDFKDDVFEYVKIVPGIIGKIQETDYKKETKTLLYLDMLNPENFTENGTLFSMVFRVKPNAAVGSTSAITTVAKLPGANNEQFKPTVPSLTLKITAVPHKIAFDANGGTGTATLTTGADGTLKGQTIPTVTNGNLVFAGWNTQKDGKGETIAAEDILKKVFAADATYYAVWTEKLPPYDITIDVNDGKTAAVGSKTDDKGILAKPADPTREGYLFTGWFTEKTGGSAVDFTKAFTKDMTVYAQWKQIFTVTFDVNGGTSAAPQAAKTDADGKITLPADPTLEGSAFDGWFDAKEGGKEVTAETVFEKDATVYAHWSKIYQVSFDVNNGTSAEPVTVPTAKGGKVDEKSWPADPTREGYVFDGWFDAKEGGSEKTKDTAFTANAALYAHWSKEYTITFEVNDGSEAEPTTQKTGKGGKLASLPAPTRDGYTLDGWYTEKEGGTKVTTATVFEEDTTLFAHWSKKSASTGTSGSSGSSSAGTSGTTKPANDKWKGSADKNWTYTGADGKVLKGSNWIEAEKHRYVFDVNGALVAGRQSTATAADGSTITITTDGDLLMNGNLYYLNPDRDAKKPATCYVMTDYLRIRPNYAGQTFYDKDGITFTGWMKSGNGGLRYQTRIPQPDKPTDLYLIVWRVQTLPECQHPDHPGDAAYNLPAGRYFFDDEGVLVQKEGWNDGKDGKEYYTNANGMVTQERAKA